VQAKENLLCNIFRVLPGTHHAVTEVNHGGVVAMHQESEGVAVT
jgi:hypothetical protein